MIDRHHLLECILWPNGDGTFRKIVNTQKRLQELGIYDDRKMTIEIEHGEHTTLHEQFKKGTEYDKSGRNSPMYGRSGSAHPMHGKGYLVSGTNNPMYGKHLSDAHKKAISESQSGDKNYWYGKDRSGSNNPRWTGDNVSITGAYQRANKLYKAGKITEEEFQPYRDKWNEYIRSKRRQSRNGTF